jgi:hypothetical protein
MNQDSEEQVPSTPALLASIKRIIKLHKHVSPGRVMVCANLLRKAKEFGDGQGRIKPLTCGGAEGI